MRKREKKERISGEWGMGGILFNWGRLLVMNINEIFFAENLFE